SQNLTGDSSRFSIRNRCRCGRSDSPFHNGKQEKLTMKILPDSSPEVNTAELIESREEISQIIFHLFDEVLVFNESGTNEVESVPMVYMMEKFGSDRHSAEVQIIKAHSQNARSDSMCTLSLEMRGLLDLWSSELKRRKTNQLAEEVKQLNFNRI
ncbi:hypothetical protein PMAYCL1PPCAC_06511, partial [Pristionchus mayeri]